MAERRAVREVGAERANHEWSYDFVNARTHGGSDLGILANKSDEPELPQHVTQQESDFPR